MTTETELIRKAGELRERYEGSKPALTTGAISMDEFMLRKSEWRAAELKMRKAVKKGTYAKIEREIKAKYEGAK